MMAGRTEPTVRCTEIAATFHICVLRSGILVAFYLQNQHRLLR